MRKYRVVMNIEGDQIPYSNNVHYTRAAANVELTDALTQPHLIGYMFDIVEVSLPDTVLFAGLEVVKVRKTLFGTEV